MADAVVTHPANDEWTMWPLSLAQGLVAILAAWGRLPERVGARAAHLEPQRRLADVAAASATPASVRTAGS